MKRLQTLLVILLLSGFGSFSLASDRWETLKAINMVENPTNKTAYGSKGELGPYQFRSSTWRMYTNKPFRMANDRETADQIAVMHYEWIKSRLTAAGIDPNDYNIALAWNCGISAVIAGNIPMQTYHYAERVNNLADLYRKSSVETPIQLVTTVKPASPTGIAQFRPVDRTTASPEFKIGSQPFQFRVAGDVPRFALAPPQSRFALVLN